MARVLAAKAVAAQCWALPVARQVKEPSAALPMAVLERVVQCHT